MRKEQRKSLGQSHPKFGVCYKRGDISTQCPQRPYTMCGEWSHIAAQCKSMQASNKHARKSGREIYAIDYEQPKVEALVSVSEPFHVFDNGQRSLSKGFGVNVVSTNNHVRKLICLHALGKEKKKVDALVDIRSACNVLSKSMCKRMGLTLSPCSHHLVGLNGLRSFVLGTVTMPCSVGGWNHDLTFMVVDHNCKIILGYTRLKKLKLSVNCENDSL